MVSLPSMPTSPSSDTAPARLGFFDGVRSFFGGVGFILGRPSVWGWAILPSLVAAVLFLALGALAVWGGSALATNTHLHPTLLTRLI